MKNLFLSIITIGIAVISCKKKEAEKNTIYSDSATTTSQYSNTSDSVNQVSKDRSGSRDSINTKTHIGGRKTSNNNTGNGTGNINAAVSDSARPAR